MAGGEGERKGEMGKKTNKFNIYTGIKLLNLIY